MEECEIAGRIAVALGLDLTPVALTFAEVPPEGLPTPPREVPSACSFWQDARQGTFYAPAERHFNCPIGAMVMGFSLPGDIQQRLGELVTGMCEHAYLDQDEAALIPTVTSQHAGIIYGPLAESTTPDVALLWVTPMQLMLCNEAIGAAKWTRRPSVLTGRPGCAALPLAMSNNTPTASLGCAGLRTFTGIGDDRLLVAVPGNLLEQFASALERAVAANAPMRRYYREQNATFLAIALSGD